MVFIIFTIKRENSEIFIGGMIIIVKLTIKRLTSCTQQEFSRIKKPGFSENQYFPPKLAMSAGNAGWTAFYITLM